MRIVQGSALVRIDYDVANDTIGVASACPTNKRSPLAKCALPTRAACWCTARATVAAIWSSLGRLVSVAGPTASGCPIWSRDLSARRAAGLARIFARTFRQRGWARSGKPKGGLRFRNRNHQHSFGLADGPTPLPLEGPETVALAPRSIRATVFLAIPEKASNITPGWFRGSSSCVPRHPSRPIGWSKTPTS